MVSAITALTPQVTPALASSAAADELRLEFVDLCGFVRADAIYTGPVGSLPQVVTRRNGIDARSYGFHYPPLGPDLERKPPNAMLYAEDGDAFVVTWELAGAGHRAEHVHRTPAECDAPKLSFSVIDNCAIHSKLIVKNDGKGAIDLLIDFGAGSTEVTAAPGSERVPIVGGLLNLSNSKFVQIFTWNPNSYGFRQLVFIAQIRRSACDGSTPAAKPDKPQALFEVTCGKVSIVWMNGKAAFTGSLRLYRNGVEVIEETIDDADGIYHFQLDAAEGDVFAVGGPAGPHGTYTYRQANARCGNTQVQSLGWTLPTTGVAIGAMTLAAVGLIGVGLLMRRLARRRRPQY